MNEQQKTKSEMNISRVPLGTASVYADGVSDVIYGVHTSKIVFSVETGPDNTYAPVQVVTLPTATLLHAATKIMQDLSQDAIVNATESRMKEHIKSLRALRAAMQEIKES